MANPEAAQGAGAYDFPDHPLYGGSGSPLRPGVHHPVGEKVAEGSIEEIIAASGQRNLEEAYLFFMGEGV